MDEDNFQLILKQCNSNFVTYEISPGIYSIEDISGAVYTMGDHERTLPIEDDDISLKTKFNISRFGGSFRTLRFDVKTFLGCAPYWDSGPTTAIHAESPGVYTSDKILNLSTIDKYHLKCDCIDDYNFDGVQQPVLYSFVLYEPPGFKVFCEPETILYGKRNKSVWKTISF